MSYHSAPAWTHKAKPSLDNGLLERGRVTGVKTGEASNNTLSSLRLSSALSWQTQLPLQSPPLLDLLISVTPCLSSVPVHMPSKLHPQRQKLPEP